MLPCIDAAYAQAPWRFAEDKPVLFALRLATARSAWIHETAPTLLAALY